MPVKLNGSSFLGLAQALCTTIPFSVSFFASSDQLGANQFPMTQSQLEADRYVGLYFEANGTGGYGIYRQPGGSGGGLQGFSGGLATALRHYVLVVDSLTSCTLYINSSTPVSGTPFNITAGDLANHNAITIGGNRINGAGLSNALNGQFAEASMFNRVLSASDVTALRTGTKAETLPGCVACFPLTNSADLVSTNGSYTLTVSGTVANGAAAHPVTRTAPDAQAPVMVGSLAVGTVTPNSIQVNWQLATDNIAVTGYETSLDGTVWTDRGNVQTYTFTGLTANTSYTPRVRGYDAAGNKATPISVTQTTPATADTTNPVMTGSVSVTNLAQTSYTIGGWGATDNVAVTGYEVSFDGGSSYTIMGNVTTYNVTGRTAGATDNVRVRAYDAAGNKATPLSTTVNLLAASSFTSGSLSRNNGVAVGNVTLTWLKLVNRTTGADMGSIKTNVAVNNSIFSTPEATMTAGTVYTAFWRESTGEYGWGEAAAA